MNRGSSDATRLWNADVERRFFCRVRNGGRAATVQGQDLETGVTVLVLMPGRDRS